MLAWGEMARQVAHEIKNPLTPIQLAAERLQRHLGITPGSVSLLALVAGHRAIMVEVLAVEALLVPEGAQCISLGTQTPIEDIRGAAQAHRSGSLAALLLTVAGKASPTEVVLLAATAYAAIQGLLTAIITERGVARAPYKESLAALVGRTARVTV